MSRSLPNYIRSYRRKSALSQGDIAFLLGQQAGTTVLRHEDDQRVPTLDAALAYAAVFRTDPRELFAGRYEEAERLVRERARELAGAVAPKTLGATVDQRTAYLLSLAESPESYTVPCDEGW